jgi:hypothetical protein
MVVMVLSWRDNITGSLSVIQIINAPGQPGTLFSNIPQPLTFLQPYLLALRGLFGYIIENMDVYIMGAWCQHFSRN